MGRCVITANNNPVIRTATVALRGAIKKMTLSTKSDNPEYQLVFLVKALSEVQMMELLTLCKAQAIDMVLSYDEPQMTFTLDDIS